MNEHLARRANLEDNCDGRFWSGRFRSQALLDESGLLTAMAYVDLNPIRAGIARTPEESEYTSIYDRIRRLRSSKMEEGEDTAKKEVPLLPFSDEKGGTPRVPYSFQDYLALVDWTGRQIRDDKRGFIDPQLPPIIHRLNIDSEAWQISMQRSGNVFGRAMGQLDHLRLHANALGQSWIRGLRKAEQLYS